MELVEVLRIDKGEKNLNRAYSGRFFYKWSTRRQRGNKKHELWEDSFEWKRCRTHTFMKQKFDYMNDNPCGKWNLVTDVTEYVHSSARYYLCSKQGIYSIMNLS